MDKVKSWSIPKRWVWEAYERVKANRGAAGVDGQTIEGFEKDLKDNLYKLWNRMSSGSYLPPPVKRVQIGKRDGGKRPLGIPTVSDRIAQAVVKAYLEPELEKHFHPDSYGYRPGKSALEAVGVARQRCWKYAWALDIDIRAFFDSISHELLMRAVRKHTDCAWVLLYIERWLKAPVQLEDGTLEPREKGSPQGSVITPLTQKRTCATSRRWVTESWRCVVSRRSSRYGDRMADDDGVVIDENLFDEQSNDTLTLNNVQRLSRRVQSVHERRKCFGQSQICGAIVCLIGYRFKFRLQGLLAPAQLRHSRAQFFEREQRFLISRHQSFHALAGTRQIALHGFRASFVRIGIAGSLEAPLDFRSNETGVFNELEDFVPYQLIEQILAHGTVIAERTVQVTVRIRSQAAVVVDLACAGARGIAVHRVAALVADDDALQDARLNGATGREAFVVLQSLVCKIERSVIHDSRHWNFDPLLTWPLAIGTAARSNPATQANRPCDSLAGNGPRLAEAGQSLVSRIAKHGPDGRALPTRDTLACWDALLVEPAGDGSDAQSSSRIPAIDVAYDDSLFLDDFVVRGGLGRFTHVTIAIRSPAHYAYLAGLGPMSLTTAGSLQNLSSFVLRYHSLELHQQLIFRAGSLRRFDKQRFNPITG